MWQYQGDRLIAKYLLAVLVFLAAYQSSAAQIPQGYYDTADDSSSSALRITLHGIIDDHARFPYTSGSTDTWDILEGADEDPADPDNILDVYRNRSFVKEGGGNSFYNREHSWPKSYGFPDDNRENYPYTDCHHLFLCDGGYNSERGNKPFRYCDASCAEHETDVNNGTGSGTGTYPGNSNWTTGSVTQETWETWIGGRGDVARAMFYMDVRYEGGVHGGTGADEPDLILTDSEALIDSGNTGNNEDVAYMGMLSVLLQWHMEDPVDDTERDRNNVIFSFQGNRNPFIDHPEWVDCLFDDVCLGACKSDSDCDDDGDDCNGREECVAGTCELVFESDCNGNGTEDACDIAKDISADANANGVPDECEPVLRTACVAGAAANRFLVRLTQGEPNTSVTFRLDESDPKTVPIDSNGRAKSKWVGVTSGLHVVSAELENGIIVSQERVCP